MQERLKRMGVVGAGGAGFPTYVKAGAQVEVFLANGAECEPLVHKDVSLMEQYPAEIVAGMRHMMQFTGAQTGKFGIKKKNHHAFEALRPHLEKYAIEPTLMGDFYPAGDEYELVYLATGRLIPPGGLPTAVGCAVNNVETLINVERAMQGLPVTDKFLSVTGCVGTPKGFWAPVGTSYNDAIRHAGGVTTDNFAILVSGILMGGISFNLDDVITKTTAGLIVLPQDHSLIKRKTHTPEARRKIGKSACDQCSYCTELCPRYLMGYDIQPHKVMRGLGFNSTGATMWNDFAQLCSSCGLCTLYSCPEDLYPREACDEGKVSMRQAGYKYEQKKAPRIHPMKEARRVPLSQLRKRLKVDQFESEAPFDASPLKPSKVRIKLSQHVGTPAQAIVSPGTKVRKGQVIGQVADTDLGVDIHASIDGVVSDVTNEYVTITA
jgi:Na+-translocating ferredoxin:NAD+ oxidoreductase RnfC subunit